MNTNDMWNDETCMILIFLFSATNPWRSGLWWHLSEKITNCSSARLSLVNRMPSFCPIYRYYNALDIANICYSDIVVLKHLLVFTILKDERSSDML